MEDCRLLNIGSTVVWVIITGMYCTCTFLYVMKSGEKKISLISLEEENNNGKIEYEPEKVKLFYLKDWWEMT